MCREHLPKTAAEAAARASRFQALLVHPIEQKRRVDFCDLIRNSEESCITVSISCGIRRSQVTLTLRPAKTEIDAVAAIKTAESVPKLR